MAQKWVVVLDSEPYAIGPFDTYEEAAKYKDTDYERDNMRTMELWSPAEEEPHHD